MRRWTGIILVLPLACCFLPLASFGAEEFESEVLSVEGDVTVAQEGAEPKQLREGDLLKKGAKIEAGKYSSANLSFDKDWQNILRMEMQTSVELESVFPPKVSLEKGAVFAKLKNLPKGSSFEVETPTALAAVRGTEYRTLVENGETQVFNSSGSEVFVYGRDTGGNVTGEPVILTNSKKTAVPKIGESPEPAELMNADESKMGEELRSEIDVKVKEAEEAGRVGKIQDVVALEKALVSKGAAEEAESRVVDTRRRPFKKV